MKSFGKSGLGMYAVILPKVIIDFNQTFLSLIHTLIS
jgi:hypothetical protein